MRVTARVDYAVRALVQLASDGKVEPVKAEHLATAQQIPLKFLLEILRQLKQHKLLVSRRGPEWRNRPRNHGRASFRYGCRYASRSTRIALLNRFVATINPPNAVNSL